MKLVVRQKEEPIISKDIINKKKGFLLVYDRNELVHIYMNTKILMHFNIKENCLKESFCDSFRDVFETLDSSDITMYLYNGKFQDIKYKLESKTWKQLE